MLPQRPRALALPAVLTLALAACGQVESPPADPGAGTTPTQPAPTSLAAPTPPAAPDDDATSEPPSEDPVHKPIPAPGFGDAGLPTGPVPEAVRQRADVLEAVRAHAERMGVDPDDVTVAGFSEVTWSDGSLGCPQPGMMYTQALVPGYQLVLEVDGQLASYHAATGRPFSFCANPVLPSQLGNPNS